MKVDNQLKYKCPICKDTSIVLVETYGKLFAICKCKYVKEVKTEKELKEMIKRICDIEGCNNTIGDDKKRVARLVIGDTNVASTTDDTCDECIERITKAFTNAMIKARTVVTRARKRMPSNPSTDAVTPPAYSG
jgi:hypothetical protein